jgi:hypothetical protein
MDVEMVRQACSCTPAKIHSDIKAVGFYCQSQYFLRFSYQFEQLQQFLFGCLAKFSDVPEGRNQQMAVVVREMIEYNKTMFCPPQHKIFVVILRLF